MAKRKEWRADSETGKRTRPCGRPLLPTLAARSCRDAGTPELSAKTLEEAREGEGTHQIGGCRGRCSSRGKYARVVVISAADAIVTAPLLPGPSMIQALPGFRDFYPAACAARRYVFETWRETARRYGFVEMDGPVLESVELYKKKSGGELVGQLFNFLDKGERHVTLRP